MKCPYQTKEITTNTHEGRIIKTQEFTNCVERECPFYVAGGYYRTSYCRKVESEARQ